MNADQFEVRRRIDMLLDSVKGDETRSRQLWQYVWAMMCVQRGLLRVVREIRNASGLHLVLEEIKTGQQRTVTRPPGIDADIEDLAVQALATILEDKRQAG